MKPEPQKPTTTPLTDLRGITRDSKRCRTTVLIQLGLDKVKWLVFGQAQLRNDTRRDGSFQLSARMIEGVTDFEHDSAYALQLPLIGVAFDSLVVHYHETHLAGWIHPDDQDGFRVPGPGYDPRKHKESRICKEKTCLGDHPKGHVIVPEDFFVPPHDLDLYRRVRGKRVEIVIGLHFEEETA